MKPIKDTVKESFKTYFKPITCLISYITCPHTLFKRKEDQSYWTVALEEKFFEYKGDIFSVYIYQKVSQNWYGKWLREEEFITLDGIGRFTIAEEKFKKVKGRCS